MTGALDRAVNRFPVSEHSRLTLLLGTDTAMDVDGAQQKMTSARKIEKKRKEAKAARVEKKQRRKPRNKITFAKKPGNKSRK